MKFKLEFNANGTWIRVNTDEVSEGAALAMLNGYAVLNQWVGADDKEKYRIVRVRPDDKATVKDLVKSN